jgi:hypothetical protein
MTMGAAPDAKLAKEEPRVVMLNLMMDGEFAGKNAIELPRKKYIAIDADLEARTWGFSRTPCFQFTYVPKDGPPNTFPEQIIKHPVVETDPCLAFFTMIYRGDQVVKQNQVDWTVGIFGNEMQPEQAKVRYWITTPDQPGEYIVEFTVQDQEQAMKGNPEMVKLMQQKIVIR